MTLQILAMHGWGSSAAHWQPWEEAWQPRPWRLRCGDRGYGQSVATMPEWDHRGLRVLLANSAGIHFLPEQVLAAAEVVVLLASFGRFVPSGIAGTTLRVQLAAMDQYLRNGDVATLFAQFRAEVAAPQPVEQLPAGIDPEEVSAIGVQRLRDDLSLLGRLEGLPAAFPKGVPVLIVEATADRIVHPVSRAELVRSLPAAECFKQEGCGHGLLDPQLIPRVIRWLDGLAGAGAAT